MMDVAAAVAVVMVKQQDDGCADAESTFHMMMTCYEATAVEYLYRKNISGMLVLSCAPLNETHTKPINAAVHRSYLAPQLRLAVSATAAVNIAVNFQQIQFPSVSQVAHCHGNASGQSRALQSQLRQSGQSA